MPHVHARKLCTRGRARLVDCYGDGSPNGGVGGDCFGVRGVVNDSRGEGKGLVGECLFFVWEDSSLRSMGWSEVVFTPGFEWNGVEVEQLGF